MNNAGEVISGIGDKWSEIKCDKSEWGKKWHYGSDILFEWPHV